VRYIKENAQMLCTVNQKDLQLAKEKLKHPSGDNTLFQQNEQIMRSLYLETAAFENGVDIPGLGRVQASIAKLHGDNVAVAEIMNFNASFNLKEGHTCIVCYEPVESETFCTPDSDFYPLRGDASYTEIGLLQEKNWLEDMAEWKRVKRETGIKGFSNLYLWQGFSISGVYPPVMHNLSEGIIKRELADIMRELKSLLPKKALA
jgi:hypothetical protein